MCVFSFFFIASHKRFNAAPIYGRVYIGKLLIHTRVRQSVVGCAARIISGTGRTPARLLVVLDLWAAQMAVQKIPGEKKQKCGRLLFIGGRAGQTDGRTEGCGGVIQINISAREQNVGNTCSQAPPHVGEDARIISTPLDRRITKTAKNGINLALPLDE